MFENLSDFLSWLSRLPKWLGASLLALLAILAFLLSMSVTSCGQTVRVTVRDTDNGVTISTSQNKRDSSGTSIQINPTLHFNDHESK